MPTDTPQTATISLTRSQAAALLASVEVALRANGGDAPEDVSGPLRQIVERLDHAFAFGLCDD